MTKQNFILPYTVGPWLLYWIEYISNDKLDADLKCWYKTQLNKVLQGTAFARTPLKSLTIEDINIFFKNNVRTKFNKHDTKLLRMYFHYALVAARNIEVGFAYKTKNLRTPAQKLFLLVSIVSSLLVVSLGLFTFTLTVDRIVNKNEDVLTAGATVMRENGLGVVVAFAEDVYYGYVQPPKIGGEPISGPNDDDSGEVSRFNDLLVAKIANNKDWGVAQSPSEIPPKLVSPVSPKKGEGTWKPTKIVVNGNTAIWIARIRPDKIHTSYWATVTWFDQKLLAFAQVPGTKVPEVSGLKPRTGLVPKNLRKFYVAGLNGGFLMRDSQGGYQFNGVTYKKLRKGKASLVTYKDGSIDVVKWGRDSTKPGIQAIRQNLELIVDGGVSQVKSENQAKWGWVWHGVGSGKNLVWRSAIGIRRDGTVVSVLGSKMSATSLADVLVRAGAVRAILLDMNASYANGYLYGPYNKGKPLDPAISIPSDRFSSVSERDFIAVYVKSPPARAVG